MFKFNDYADSRDYGLWVERQVRKRHMLRMAYAFVVLAAITASGIGAKAVERIDAVDPAPAPPRELTTGLASEGGWGESVLVTRTSKKRGDLGRGSPSTSSQPSDSTGNEAKSVEPMCGCVSTVDLDRGIAFVCLDRQETLPAGTCMSVYHRYLTGVKMLGILRVVESSPGMVMVRPIGRTRLTKVGRGDPVVVPAGCCCSELTSTKRWL